MKGKWTTDAAIRIDRRVNPEPDFSHAPRVGRRDSFLAQYDGGGEVEVGKAGVAETAQVVCTDARIPEFDTFDCWHTGLNGITSRAASGSTTPGSTGRATNAACYGPLARIQAVSDTLCRTDVCAVRSFISRAGMRLARRPRDARDG